MMKTGIALSTLLAATLCLSSCGGGGGGGSAGSPGDPGGGNVGGGIPLATTTFTSKDLAPLAPAAFSSGVAINDDGLAVGLADDGTVIKAVKWASADAAPTATQLDPLPGNNYSAAYGVNAAGVPVGESQDGASVSAVFWPADATAASTLSTTGLPAGKTAAFGINTAGEIVGELTDSDGISTALYWASTSAAPIILGNLSAVANAYSTAYFIGEAGEVAGESLNASGQTQAVLWIPAAGGLVAGQTASPLASVTGQLSSTALSVNLNGLAVGEALLAGGETQGVLWNPDGTLAQTLGANSSAQSINNNRIVGFIKDQSGTDIATIWNANDITDNLSLSAGLSHAFGINESDQIVGTSDTGAFAALPQL